MGTKSVRVTMTEDAHGKLKAQKGDATWMDVLEAGCEVLDDE